MLIFLLFPVSILQEKGVIMVPKVSNATSDYCYFNATRAYQLINEQIQFGPRIPGSEARGLQAKVDTRFVPG